MTIQSELLLIKNDHELLTAEEVHDWAAKNKKSEIAKSLEWDDSTAGYQYRLWQIRRLMAVHIVYDDGTRKLVSLSIDRSKKGGGYRDVDDILRDRSLHSIMLEDALKELSRLEVKYEKLAALKPVWREAAKARRKYENGKKKKEIGAVA